MNTITACPVNFDVLFHLAIVYITHQQHYVNIVAILCSGEAQTLDITTYILWKKARYMGPNCEEKILELRLTRLFCGKLIRRRRISSLIYHNRRQRVCIQGKFSTWTAVTSGVPQGSERRNRAGLIEVIKLSTVYPPCLRQHFFEFRAETMTRGHSLKMIKKRSRTSGSTSSPRE